MTPAGRPAEGREPGGIERLRRSLRHRLPPDDEALFAAIAAQVAARRRHWDLSQAELAELCGTTQSAIARLERGGRPPRIDTLMRIAAALDSELVVELRPRTTSDRQGDGDREHPR
jgi:ribosome-binding protein aMBF1 (putative translation factor)